MIILFWPDFLNSSKEPLGNKGIKFLAILIGDMCCSEEEFSLSLVLTMILYGGSISDVYSCNTGS